MTIGPETLAALALVAFIAGFIDAIAGGGGMLTVPALALAGLDPVSAVATNKLNGTLGAASASLAFARAGHFREPGIWRLPLAAGVGGVAGALALSHVPRDLVAAGLPVALIAVAIYFALSPRMRDEDGTARLSPGAHAALVIPLIGFYDGVFGPGAGSFYLMSLVALAGLGVVKASARGRLANLASNLASLAAYVALGQVAWTVGLAMGAAQFLGSYAGARSAMRNGARLIRPLLICVSCAMALRLAFGEGAPPRQWLGGFFG